MTRFRLRRGWLLVLVAAAILAGVVEIAGADAPDRPDLALAIRSNGACGTFGESLPALVTRTGIEPEQDVGDVTVCVANVGRGPGALHLRIEERVELDSGCGGDEAASDGTCGGGAPGELGPALVQQIRLDHCGKAASPIVSPPERRLTELESPLLLADRLTRGQLVCVQLVLRYSPADAIERVVSQSDKTSWRYAFDLTSGK